jgi:outer membrane protein assembly factor BamB
MKMINKNRLMLSIFGCITMLATATMDVKAQDWSQWRGPNREGIFKGTNLNLDWTAKTPPLSWTFKQAGAGYSAPTIIGTTLFCQGAADGNDFAFALDTKTGNLKWKQDLGAEHIDSQNRGNGPRGSVTVDGDKLYLIRGGGQIHCLSAADGKILWQKDFVKDFNGKMMSSWGFSESPLIDGNLVICSPGGAEGTVMAFDKNTGTVVWRANELTDNASHSSAIIAEVDGIRQYILLTNKCAAGVAAKDGKLLWTAPIEGARVSAVIPTPIYNDNLVYVSNAYGVGCFLVKLTKAGEKFNAEVVYANQNMVNQHGGVVLENGYIYGFTDGMGFTCQNLKTGEIVWREKVNELVKGATLAVNDRLLLLNEQTGLLAVVAASPDGWKEFGRMEIPERSKVETTPKMVWTHPVVANGKLYLRDHDLLFCFDLQK